MFRLDAGARAVLVLAASVLACGNVADDVDAAATDATAEAVPTADAQSDASSSDAATEASLVACDGGDFVAIVTSEGTTILDGGCADAGPSVAQGLCRNVICEVITACGDAGEFFAAYDGQYGVIDWEDAGGAGTVNVTTWPPIGGTASGTFEAGSTSGSFCVKRLN